MSKLAQLRAKLLEKENKQKANTYDNSLYPFWNIKENEQAVMRFLPDADESNPYFWVEAQKIRLTFPSVKGQTNTSGRDILVQVPCNEMYGQGNICPIHQEIRPWFKDPEMEDLARQYWKKRSFIFQGFVRENPIDEAEAPENPIRRFSINTSIFDIIRASLMDEEMEEMPTDYVKGTDFRLVKTKQGQYASYKTSTYSRKSTSLTEDELAAIENYGLNTLSDYLPKQPSEEELNIIQKMWEDSVEGNPYDPDKYAQYYRPSGVELKTGGGAPTGATTKVENTTPATKKNQPKIQVDETEDDDTPPFDGGTEVEAKAEPEMETEEVTTPKPAAKSEGKKSPEDIIAAIKARHNK